MVLLIEKRQDITKIAAWLRFPLCVLVVLIHSGFGLATDTLSLDIPEAIKYMIRDTIAAFAVPSFFTISGYLFFYRVKTFDVLCYKYKLTRRFRSLFIPYLIWNLFYFLLFAFKAKYLGGGGVYASDSTHYNLRYLLIGLWSTQPFSGENVPIYFAFWFIRDLMVMVVLSPVFYWGIRKLGKGFLCILLIYAIVSMQTEYIPHVIMPLAPLFFSIGCYFSINGIEKLKLPSYKMMALYGLMIFILFSIEYNFSNNKLFHYSIVLIGFPSLIFLGGYLSEGLSINKFFSDSSFFVYALHIFFLSITNKLLFIIFHPQSQALSTIVYLLSIVCVVISCCLTYTLVKHFMPTLARIMNGGR